MPDIKNSSLQYDTKTKSIKGKGKGKVVCHYEKENKQVHIQIHKVILLQACRRLKLLIIQ